jgi:hypothetical protein
VGDSVKVTDVQGFVANVNKHVAIDDSKTFHPVDKVLLPGNYLLANWHPDQLQTRQQRHAMQLKRNGNLCSWHQRFG